MKKHITLVALFILHVSLYPQQNSETSVKSLFSLKPASVQDYTIHRVSPNAGAEAQLYLFGFNRKGHLAYLVGRIPGMESFPQWTLVVHDLVTDQAVQKITFEDEENETVNYAYFVRQWGTRIIGILKKHEIEAAYLKINKFPMTAGKDSIHATIIQQKNKADAVDKGSTCYETFLISQKRGRKTIGSVVCDNELFVIYREILGYIRNPNEKRIALIIRQSSEETEATFVTEFIILGAHLEKGF